MSLPEVFLVLLLASLSLAPQSLVLPQRQGPQCRLCLPNRKAVSLEEAAHLPKMETGSSQYVPSGLLWNSKIQGHSFTIILTRPLFQPRRISKELHIIVPDSDVRGLGDKKGGLIWKMISS